jgi:hypothetical protein
MAVINKTKESLKTGKQWKWWLAFGVQFIVNIVLISFWLGRLENRTDNLEQGREQNRLGISDLNTKMDDHLTYHIELNGVVKAIGENVLQAKEGVRILSEKYDKYLFETAKYNKNE